MEMHSKVIKKVVKDKDSERWTTLPHVPCMCILTYVYYMQFKCSMTSSFVHRVKGVVCPTYLHISTAKYTNIFKQKIPKLCF